MFYNLSDKWRFSRHSALSYKCLIVARQWLSSYTFITHELPGIFTFTQILKRNFYRHIWRRIATLCHFCYPCLLHLTHCRINDAVTGGSRVYFVLVFIVRWTTNILDALILQWHRAAYRHCFAHCNTIFLYFTIVFDGTSQHIRKILQYFFEAMNRHAI